VITIINAKEKLEQMTEKAESLKAIAHPIRLCIVNGLINDPGCNVTKIQSCLDLPQSTISQHLAKLRTAGIVDARRSGLEVNYYVVDERIIKIVKVLVD